MFDLFALAVLAMLALALILIGCWRGHLATLGFGAALALVSWPALADPTALDLVTQLAQVPGAGPYIAAVLPWLLLTGGIASIVATMLPPPASAASAYGRVYTVVNWLALNVGHARNATAPKPPVAALLLGLAVAVALAACSTTTTNGATTVANGWTVQSAANVELSAALSLEKQFATLETQLPGEAADIKAAGQALAAGVSGQVNGMLTGSSPGAQSEAAALNAVIAVLPNLSGIISAAQTGGLSVPTAISDAIAFLQDDVTYVLPAVVKANAGTTTAADVATAQAALTAAAGAL